jgi:hypothetical protein
MTRKPLVHVPGHDNFPPNLSPDERLAASLPGLSAAQVQAMSLETTSPTGTPVIPPHTIGFKVLALVMAAAAAVAAKMPDIIADTEVDQQVALFLVAVIGFVSPGLRRK